MKRYLLISVVVLLVIGLIFDGCSTPGPAPAPAPSSTAKPTTVPSTATLPKVISFSTLGVGTTKYVQAIAFRQAVEKYTPMAMRIIPGEGFAERAGAVTKGDAEFTALGIVDVSDWVTGTKQGTAFGPQPARWVWRGEPQHNALAVRGNSDIKTIQDLKGRRIPQFTSSSGWNDQNIAYLAFGGLTLKDVQVVNVSGVSEGQGAVVSGVVDASTLSLNSASATELAASRYGIRWLSMPESDAEGWKRLHAVLPLYSPRYREATGLKPGEKIWASDSGPTGIEALSTLSPDVVYQFCKAMYEGYKDYSTVSKELALWTWDLAYDIGGLEASGVPWHDGSIRFFKEKGVWSPAHEAMQQKTLAMENERLGKKK